jgi:hypothetical protein
MRKLLTHDGQLDDKFTHFVPGNKPFNSSYNQIIVGNSNKIYFVDLSYQSNL